MGKLFGVRGRCEIPFPALLDLKDILKHVMITSLNMIDLSNGFLRLAMYDDFFSCFKRL